MANLIPVSSFDDVIALEKGNPIIGARLGMSNKQAQQLLNRMTYIRESIEHSIDDAHDEIDDSIYELDLTERALKQRMDDIEEKSDIVDVVATYSDILNYDTSALNLNSTEFSKSFLNVFIGFFPFIHLCLNFFSSTSQ